MKAARENPANVQVTSGIYDIPGTMIEITLLGTGSPIPDPNRAGPATLVRAGGQTFLVDCGRGVLQRAAAIGVVATGLSALLLTHLHSDHTPISATW